MENRITLDGQWKLCLIENNKLKENITTVADLEKADGIRIDAHVPGNFELDLFSAGIEKDPYVGSNLWDYYKYENRHLFYYRNFKAKNNREYELCFDGIDTIADVYVNGKKVLSCDNMMIEYKTNVESVLEDDNEIVVHIKPVMIEGRKYDYSMRAWQNSLYGAVGRSVRKPAHMFGWDIMPRAVSGGIYKSCYLLQKKPAKVKDVCYVIDEINTEENYAYLSFVYNLQINDDFLNGYNLEFVGKCEESSFYQKCELWHTSGMLFRFKIDNAKFWYPKNYGKACLYNVKAVLKKDGVEVDCYEFTMGLRTVELVRSSVVEKDGCFYFKVNGQRIFSLGTNWTPLDCFHSKDKERLPKALEALDDLGCNIVRCWGGNLYEDHEFFDFCDKKGIMVWQDFSLGCGLYPNDAEFLERMREEATFIVKKLRNHPSLCLWAGDNECDLFSKWLRSDPKNAKVTREVFPDVINDYDFQTPYLPSSPYFDEVAYKTGLPTSETHSWGDRNYFKSDFYKNVESYFQSEIGYQASPSPDSLRKYISEDKLFPWTDEEKSKKYGKPMPNDEQCAHIPNVENNPESPFYFLLPLTDKQIAKLFTRAPKNIDEYVMMSQISQAEAFKYFIERVRIRKGEKSGIIWWNLLEGYPVHSNAVVDYYFVKKLAYYYIKRSQQPLALMFDEPENGKLKLYATSELLTDENVSYTVVNVTTGETLVSSSVDVKAGEVICIDSVAEIPEKAFLLISYSYGDNKCVNHYMCNMPSIDFDEYIASMKGCGIFNFEGFSNKK